MSPEPAAGSALTAVLNISCVLEEFAARASRRDWTVWDLETGIRAFLPVQVDVNSTFLRLLRSERPQGLFGSLNGQTQAD